MRPVGTEATNDEKCVEESTLWTLGNSLKIHNQDHSSNDQHSCGPCSGSGMQALVPNRICSMSAAVLYSVVMACHYPPQLLVSFPGIRLRCTKHFFGGLVSRSLPWRYRHSRVTVVEYYEGCSPS